MIGIAGYKERVRVKDGETSEITKKRGPSHDHTIPNFTKKKNILSIL